MSRRASNEGSRRRPRATVLWAAVPALGLALAFGLLLPRNVCPSGCSRIEDTRAVAGSCWTSPGDACYECYYADQHGFRTCYENPEGTRSYCTDYQQVPF